MVQTFYKVGLAAGGKDNGKPGLRDYHPGYYAAFLIDPDGKNIEPQHGRVPSAAPWQAILISHWQSASRQ